MDRAAQTNGAHNCSGGGPAGIRTQDTKIKSLMLYQAELPALSNA